MRTQLIYILAFNVALTFSTSIIAAEPVSFYSEPSDASPSRVGGKSRGASGKPIQVLVLAPDHTGLTIKAQPTLYWYQSDSTDHDIEITIVDDNKIEPLLETRLKGSSSVGIHPVNLKTFDVKLEKNIEYRWFVAVVNDKEQRSTDVITGGTIKRIDPTEVNIDITVTSTVKDKFTALAKAGVWYDAMDTISTAIEKTGDKELVKIRNQLFSQVGLQDAINK